MDPEAFLVSLQDEMSKMLQNVQPITSSLDSCDSWIIVTCEAGDFH